MNKRGNAIGVTLVILMGILVFAVIGGGIWFATQYGDEQQSIGGATVDDVAKATSYGGIAQIKVYVRSISENDINTKVAVPIYCVDDQGTMILDGSISSTTAGTSGSTTRGRTVSCYAFNSTYQTAEQPDGLQANQKYQDRVIDEEIEHIVIDAYAVSTNAEMTFYDDTLTVANDGASNVTITGEGSDSFLKMRFKNNNSDQWLPLGGFYFNTPTGTNISNIDLSGSASLSGMDKASTQIEESSLSTKASARRDNWDYVFEVTGEGTKDGMNMPLILEENDYLETGAVMVTSDVGCDAVEENLVTGYAFTKGYYRATKSAGVLFGHETDASASSVITADLTGSTFYCDD